MAALTFLCDVAQIAEKALLKGIVFSEFIKTVVLQIFTRMLIRMEASL
jgi:hypothetical protein